MKKNYVAFSQTERCIIGPPLMKVSVQFTSLSKEAPCHLGGQVLLKLYRKEVGMTISQDTTFKPI